MSAPLSESQQRIRDRFEDAWNGPTPPSIEDYLRGCEPAKRRALLIELIYIDLERRLAAGERVRVDELYLRRFPVLNDDRAAVIALAKREFEVRRHREPDLSPSQFLERWQDYRDDLMHLLDAHLSFPTTSDNTRNGKAGVDGQKISEETRDVLAFLSPPQAADEVGRLGGYRILKVLGSGGMGVVLLAEDAQLQRPVALKVMRPALAANDAARQRFLREARAVAALKHDHIVTIYQVGEDRGVPFLAMEFLEGESLHDRLKCEPTLPVVEVLRLGVEIAEALAAAHARGLIHRDIKPGNIWLERANRSLTVAAQKESEPRPLGSGADGRGAVVRTRVKLLDFGLARPAGGEDAHLTQTGVILGTPAFMSPEQARGEKVDPRSDLFSLGCVLYRMVTGQMAFQGRDMMSTLLSLANDHPKPPRQLNPHVPPALNQLIQRLLAKNVADRPPTAAAVVAALRSIEDDWSRPVPALAVADTLAVPAVVEAKPSPRIVTSAVPVAKRPGRRRLALSALALFGMAVLLGAIIIRIRSKDGRETTIEVPEGRKVTIDEDGKIAVDLSRDRKGAVVPPLVEGTEALSRWALVRQPARLKGVRSWTIETRMLRGGSIACAMRPDGKQLAVSSFDGVIRLYDPITGRLQQALFGQQKDSSASSLAWSPDGKRLASCGGFGNLNIWNAATGQLIRTIPPNSRENCCVAWSPDGKLLAFGTTGGVTLWEPDSGKQALFPVQFAGYPTRLAWSSDSKTLAAASTDKFVRLWVVPSGKLLHKFEGYQGYWPAMGLSPDGNTLVFAASEKELRVWDVHSGKLLRTLQEPNGRILSVAFSPDGSILAYGTNFWSIIVLIRTGDWKGFRFFTPGINQGVRSITWSPDGATLAAAIHEDKASIFDVKTGKELRRIETHPPPGPSAWSSDGMKIASVQRHEVRIWDADSGVQIHRIENVGKPLAWSPRGISLAVIGNNQVHILDGEIGQRLRSWNAPVIPEYFPAWSPDGKLIATAATDKTVQVWAAASGRLVHTLKGHTANVGAIAWSPDGKLIASGSEGDKKVRLWDASSGKQIHSFDADGCVRLAWSPDGQSLASGRWQDSRTWDMTTKESQVRCRGPLLGWSADSKAVLTEGWYMLKWWDRQTGELLRRVDFPLMAWPVLSPNSQIVAFPNGGALHIGDVFRGKSQLKLVPLRAGQWLAVRPDGHYRGSPGVEKEIIYIVQTDAGQEVLAPDEFAKKYGWKNDPERVRLPRK
ncbi:MAG TPA: protein kinase [Gemmataceae bacterium]|nr:protein kinase [Gemmataceae bacterium]